MSEPVTLLPPNRTPWEKALSLTSAARRPLPAGIVRDAINPWTAPEHLLPWLAWSWSIDLWNDGWTVERKRRVIARAARLHRLKGTEAGLRELLELVEAELRQVVVPPQRVFATRTLTKEEMDAWLMTMPQIRVYLAREVGSAVGLSFVGNFAGHSFACFDAGRALLGRAARLWDRGIEQRLVISEVTTETEARQALQTERVSVPGHAGYGAFEGRYAGHCFAGAVAVEARLVTFRQSLAYNHRTSALSLASARPSLDPVDVRAERISTPGQDSYSAFPRRFVSRSFAREDRAAWMLYDRIVLHDPSRAVPRVAAWSFANYSRVGHAPFTAKAVIDLKHRLAPRTAAAERGYVGHHFARPEDNSRRQAADLAVRVSKAARDRILTTNKLTRPITFADRIPLDGSVKFGGRKPFRL